MVHDWHPAESTMWHLSNVCLTLIILVYIVAHVFVIDTLWVELVFSSLVK